MNKADFDEEANAAVTPKAPGRGSRQMFEAAALLLMWSVLALNEGAVRFLVSRPALSPDVTASRTPEGMRIVPTIVYHVGAIFECVFAILGLMVGSWSLLADGGGVLVTGVFLVIQTVLGWYVFATFVFLEPAFRAANLEMPLFGLTDVGQSKFAVIMGLFGSITFCLSLQGGQFIMGLRLLNYQSNGKKFPQSTTLNRGRTLFWNGNMIFGGAAGIALSALLIHEVGNGRLAAPFAAPPFVGLYPVLNLIASMFMVLHGAIGMAVAFSKKLFTLLAYFTIPTYLIMFLNFVIWNPAAIPMAPPQAAAYHSGLIIVTIFLGTYFAYQYYKETETVES